MLTSSPAKMYDRTLVATKLLIAHRHTPRNFYRATLMEILRLETSRLESSRLETRRLAGWNGKAEYNAID